MTQRDEAETLDAAAAGFDAARLEHVRTIFERQQAGDLASFYELLARGGVTRAGQRLVSAQTLLRYTSGGAATYDKSNRIPLRIGRGFLLGSRTPSIYGWWNTQRCFGHAGAFCTLAWADRQLEFSAAIVTNGNRGPFESLFRFAPLGSAIRRACV
jgi:CubicO group peptidase (beta-lactamase class C family)